MSLSPRRLAATTASLAGLLALAIAAPSANAALFGAAPVPAKRGGVCANQTFGQPFVGIGDVNWYTLAPGGDFETNPSWTFYGGASIKGENVPAVVPGTGAGHSLSIPENGAALSPSMCVTSDYPTLRMFVKGLRSPRLFGSGLMDGLHVSIVYPTPGQGWGWKALYSATIKASGVWTPSQSMPTHAEWMNNPSLRLYFYADGGSYLVDNVFVDPKLRG